MSTGLFRADDTLAALTPRLPFLGVTRVANVTGFDVLGIPAAIAVRPLAVTAPVSAAAGMSPAGAKAAAALAAAALHHAETAVPPADETGATAADLGPAARLETLDLPPGSLAGASTPLDWVRARPLSGGGRFLVPRGLVTMGPLPGGRWRPGRLSGTAGGLAAGVTRLEAVTGALLSLADADAAEASRSRPGSAAALDLDTVPDPWLAGRIRWIRAAGGTVTAAAVPGPDGLARFTVRVRMEDTDPLVPAGAGAHPDPARALRRALCAAAVSRLRLVTGVAGRQPGPEQCRGPRGGQGPGRAWDDLFPPGNRETRPGGDAARILAAGARAGALAVDLESWHGLHAVKVLCPRGPAREAA